MIRIKLDIQCDRCGIIEHREELIEYGIDGLVAEFTQKLLGDGWKFGLAIDVCKHCYEKEEAI